MVRRGTASLIMASFALLATAGCSRSDPAENISEDQMNHFTGIDEHDHPDNAANPVAYPGQDNMALTP